MKMEQLFEEMKTGVIYENLDLKQIIEENGSQHVVDELLNNIGNTHSLIRENIYSVTYTLIDEKFISHEECIRIFETCLSDRHLFKGIGGKDDDTVFVRAFSSLIVAAIVSVDKKHNLLSEEQYMFALNKGIEYMEQEVDRRGFVLGKGWAHAVGHGTYMFNALIDHENFPMEYADKILNCIKVHITSGHRFVDQDEKSLACAIPLLLEKGLSEDVVQTWIDSLLPKIRSKAYTDEHYQDVFNLFNIEYFLTALHFTLAEEEVGDELRKHLIQYVPTMWERAHADDESELSLEGEKQ